MSKSVIGELLETNQRLALDRKPNSQVSAQGLLKWKKATFGMFIHWGLSAHKDLSGGYQGVQYDTLAEWVPFAAQIPMSEYKQLAQSFNPSEFDAQRVAQLAHDTGMRYMVFTAKHHDGFAMYHSKAHPFNITTATPFARDPVRELSEACQEQGIGFGLYYSHVIDWESQDACTKSYNSWDYDISQGNYQSYWKNKSLAQMEELASSYGELTSMWFDMGGFDLQTESEHVAKTNELIQRLRHHQPNMVINSRVTSPEREHLIDWDIVTGHDNYMEPTKIKPWFWEGIATTNDSWGFNRYDQNPKRARDVINQLCTVVSRGGNFLLNIGLDHLGRVPQEIEQLLAGVGDWMQVHGNAIHECYANPFNGGFHWGCVTHNPETRTLYFILPRLPEHQLISLKGLNNAVCSARFMDDNTGRVGVLQQKVSDTTTHTQLTIQAPEQAFSMPQVIEVCYDGELLINNEVHQDRLYQVYLDGQNCCEANQGDKHYQWQFHVTVPGRYDVSLRSTESMHHKQPRWVHHGKRGTVRCAGSEQAFSLSMNELTESNAQVPWKDVLSHLATIEIEQPGIYTLDLNGIELSIDESDKYGSDMVNFESLTIKPSAH